MAEGLIKDCRLLLSRFEAQQSVRFGKFCDVWKEMNFSLIHCGGRDVIGQNQIVDFLYRIISTYLSESCTFQYRIGALYAIYSVYQTQPCEPKLKIRMTLSMWNELMGLHQEIKDQEHYDADYILRKLKNEKAFLFVAAPVPLIYGARESIISEERETNSAVGMETDTIVEETYETLQRLSSIHNSYENTKARLQEDGESSLGRSARVISENLVDNISSELEKFQDWRSQHQKNVQERKSAALLHIKEPKRRGLSTTAGGPGTTPKTIGDSEQSSSSISSQTSRAKRMQELKNKQFTSVGKVSRSMRHLRPNVASSSQQPSPKRSRKKR